MANVTMIKLETVLRSPAGARRMLPKHLTYLMAAFLSLGLMAPQKAQAWTAYFYFNEMACRDAALQNSIPGFDVSNPISAIVTAINVNRFLTSIDNDTFGSACIESESEILSDAVIRAAWPWCIVHRGGRRADHLTRGDHTFVNTSAQYWPYNRWSMNTRNRSTANSWSDDLINDVTPGVGVSFVGTGSAPSRVLNQRQLGRLLDECRVPNDVRNGNVNMTGWQHW